MEFIYRRVSTADQKTDRQLPEQFADREYEDKLSGKDLNRPQLQAMLQTLRAGDVVHVHELSRLGRSLKDLLEIVGTVVDIGATIHFHKENLRFEQNKSDPFQELMLNLLGSFAQFERNCILQRQKEGIAIRVIDLYSVKPLDQEALEKAAKETRAILTVEDHYPEGGIGEAVAAALAHNSTPVYFLAVKKLAKSATSNELLVYEEISKDAIVKKVKEVVSA